MKNKILTIIIILLTILFLPLVIYLKILPQLVSGPKVIGFVQEQLEKNFGIKSVIVNPVLKTELSPNIEFYVDNFELNDESGRIFALNDFELALSLKKIFSKTIILKKMGANLIYADINKLSKLKFPAQNKKQTKNDWNIDIYDSVLYLKKSLILYSPEDITNVKLTANDLSVDNTQKEQRFLHFNLDANIKKKDKELNIKIQDRNTVYFKDNHFYVKKCPLDVNKSKIYFDLIADRNKNFTLDIYSDKILVDDVLTFINSQIIENNIQESLVYFDDLKGSFNFKLKITNDDLNGTFNLNNVSAKIIPVQYIPINISQGNIFLTKDKITLKNLKGYYSNNLSNKISMEGTIDDYLKSIDTKLTIRSVVSNDFMQNYLSKMVGMNVSLIGGSTGTKLEFKSKNNKIDMKWLFGLGKGKDILVDNMSVGATDIPKGVSGDMHLENNILTIRSLDYYMIPTQLMTKENRDNIKPILKFKGNIDIANNSEIRDLGFSIPNPLPSEFLNFIIKQRIFKGGKISGDMYYVISNGIPVLQGNLKMDKVGMPSQRLFFREAEMDASSDGIKVSAKGGYRRAKYDIKGLLTNELKFPVVVKDLDLSVDNVDVEKFLASANNQKQEAIQSEKFDWAPSGEAKDDDDDTPTFDIGNFVVEKSLLKIEKGKYKDMEFANIKADMTLNRNSVLNITSNDFDIAEGKASAEINCKLKQHLYDLVLKVKDVNSDIIAANILNLHKEISGKSSGEIKLNTDASMKLNGTMTFDIKDGIIQKVGLVEYALTVASIFRNPLTMVSPAILSDLINVPEGRFDKIYGRLMMKDNVIERIMIKSTAPQLSTFIVGSYNLENSDASLRVYTKFSNKNRGIFGFLRNISLNSLANSIPLSRRNDVNYYAAELEMLPKLDVPDKDCQVFLTKIDGDVEHNNFISSLKKIK